MLKKNLSLKDLPNLNAVWASLCVEELVRLGVTDFFTAPGSRSGALASAVARHPRARKIVHFDERALAFLALGFVSAAGRPAVLICTSGTAAANFLPAVIEASKKKLPLIVITADRPAELQKTGAQQTIDQGGIYGKFVRDAFELPCSDAAIPPEFLLTTIDQALSRAKGELPGPVHINWAFREPLAFQKVAWPQSRYLASIAVWLKSRNPYTQYLLFEKQLSTLAAEEAVRRLRLIRRGLIVVGKLKGPEDLAALMKFAESTGFPVFADITSGLRLGTDHDQLIRHFDLILLSAKTRRELCFDGVIHFGGRMTSKRFYEFMREIAPREYISVLAHPLRSDPQHQVTLRVVAPVAEFCQRVLPFLNHQMQSLDLVLLRKAQAKVAQVLNKLFTAQRLSEPALAYHLSGILPMGSGLFLGNSMPVRDMDMFAASLGTGVAVFGNRGASGIDGLIASACGVADATQKVVTALVGDVSFLHDLNSLAILRSLKPKLILIIVNNDGGGIFSFLPSATDPAFEPIFATPHGMSFKDIGKAFGLTYFSPKTVREFTLDYQRALKIKGPVIVEIKTNRQTNVLEHQRLLKAVVTALEGKS